MIKPTRYAIYFGLLAGSLAIAPIAKADIPITGGKVTGDAAFFVPNLGQTVLFDAATRTLRLETPNGVTVNSIFTPTAGRLNGTANPNGIPGAGDTGTLQGTLAGRAFTSSGQPVFFQGVPTRFDFTLTAFTSTDVLPGTLISPKTTGAFPLVFLPVANVTLSPGATTVFNQSAGNLRVGPFEANIPGGTIGLPGDLKFGSISTIPDSPSGIGRRFKFDLEGTGTPGGGSTVAANSVKFNSANAITTFKIQSIGTQASQEIKLTGTATGIDLSLEGTSTNAVVGAFNAVPITYQVKGQGPGLLALVSGTSSNASGISYISNNASTQYNFSGNGFSLTGTSSGKTQFTLGIPVGGLNQYTPPTESVPNFGPETPNNTPTITEANPTTTTNTNIINTTYINFFNITAINNSNIVYTVYSPGYGKQELRGRGRGRGLAKGRGQDRVVYAVVGPSSRVFPGLVGLRQLPAQEVAVDGDDDGGDDD